MSDTNFFGRTEREEKFFSILNKYGVEKCYMSKPVDINDPDTRGIIIIEFDSPEYYNLLKELRTMFTKRKHPRGETIVGITFDNFKYVAFEPNYVKGRDF